MQRSLRSADCGRHDLFDVLSQDRKTQNLAILRANSSTSSVQKLTKQKSEKIYSTTVKEAFTGTKTCKNVADEFVIAAEVIFFYVHVR